MFLSCGIFAKWMRILALELLGFQPWILGSSTLNAFRIKYRKLFLNYRIKKGIVEDWRVAAAYFLDF